MSVKRSKDIENISVKFSCHVDMAQFTLVRQIETLWQHHTEMVTSVYSYTNAHRYCTELQCRLC
jgi:hypothetical protein